MRRLGPILTESHLMHVSPGEHTQLGEPKKAVGRGHTGSLPQPGPTLKPWGHPSSPKEGPPFCLKHAGNLPKKHNKR